MSAGLAIEQRINSQWPHGGDCKRKPSLAELAKELTALDRYEGRALSRRKFAIRAFDLAWIEAERPARDAVAASFGGVRKGG